MVMERTFEDGGGKTFEPQRHSGTTVSQVLITMTLQEGRSLKPRIQANRSQYASPPPSELINELFFLDCCIGGRERE